MPLSVSELGSLTDLIRRPMLYAVSRRGEICQPECGEIAGCSRLEARRSCRRSCDTLPMISEFRNDTYALPDDIYFVWSLQNVAPTVLLLAMLVLSQATSSLAF